MKKLFFLVGCFIFPFLGSAQTEEVKTYHLDTLPDFGGFRIKKYETLNILEKNRLLYQYEGALWPDERVDSIRVGSFVYKTDHTAKKLLLSKDGGQTYSLLHEICDICSWREFRLDSSNDSCFFKVYRPD